MVGWIILGVIAFFILMLCIPVCIVVSYRTAASPNAYLRWLFFKYDLMQEASQEKKPKKTKKPKKNQDEKKSSKKKKPMEFSEQLALIVDLLGSLKGGTGVLIRRFRIYRLRLSILVAEDDAAETAIAYGKVSAAVYGAYTMAQQFLNMAPPEIDIRPVFTASEGEILLDVRARLMPIVAIGAAIRIGVSFLTRLLRRGAQDKHTRRPERPARPDRADAAQAEDRADRADRDDRADREPRGDAQERADRADREPAQARSGAQSDTERAK